MKAFPDTIQLEDVGMSGESRIFRTLTRFRFYSEKHGLIEVPAGTYTDGASIPRPFWNILSPFGPLFKAALPHDYLYSPGNEQFNRAEADMVLREGMEILDAHELEQMSRWRRRLAKVKFAVRRAAVYRAVRAFGWRSFRGSRK